MQGDNSGREGSSPAVGLFQKAHGKMVMLQRLDALGYRTLLPEELEAADDAVPTAIGEAV